jgi:hypothetical protein
VRVRCVCAAEELFVPPLFSSSASDTGKCLVQSEQEGGGVFVDLSEPILRYCSREDVIDALLVHDVSFVWWCVCYVRVRVGVRGACETTEC